MLVRPPSKTHSEEEEGSSDVLGVTSGASEGFFQGANACGKIYQGICQVGTVDC